MKKGAKAVLEGQWWSKNKAKTMKSSGLGQALRIYEVKLDHFDWDKALKELAHVRKAVTKALDLASPSKHAETIAVLKQYPELITKEEKRIKAKISADEKGLPTIGPPPKQEKGRPQVIWSKSIGDSFTNAYGKKHPRLVSFKGGKLELKINADIADVLKREGEAVMLQRMVDSANKVFDKGLAELDSFVTSAGTKVKDKEKMEASIAKATTALAKKMKVAIHRIPEDEWKKFLAKHKQYKEYKISVGFDAALTGLKVIGTGVSLAAAIPTGGASLALTVFGGIQLTADALKQVRNASQKAEKVIHRLEKNLKKLQKDFQDADKHVRANAATAGGIVANTVLSYPVLPSLGTAAEDLALADNKTAGLNVAAVKLGKAVEANIKGVDKVGKTLKSLNNPKAVAQAMDKLRKVRRMLDKSLSACSDMGARVRKCEEAIERNQELLKEAEGATSDHLQRFEKVFPVVFALTMAAANAGVGFKEASDALDKIETSIGLGNDILEEIKGQVE